MNRNSAPRFLFDPGEQLSERSARALARYHGSLAERRQRRLFFALLWALLLIVALAAR